MAEIIPVAEMGEGFDQDGVSQRNQLAPSLDDDGAERVQEEAYVSLPMEDLVPNLISKINKDCLVQPRKLKVSSGSISCSIHRVPRNIRQHYNAAYDPQVVSIGPFHYEKRRDQLKAMEEHKRRYLHDILSRNDEGSLERYLVAVKELEEKARSCYAEEIELDSSSFVEMMVLDGCFIFELFRKASSKEYYEDPIFELPWLGQAVYADLQFLENQIPFFILKCLFDRIDPTNSLDLLGTTLAAYSSGSCSLKKIMDSNIEILHLLHFRHTCLVLSMKEKCPEKRAFQTIPCATKLEEAGIKFRKMGNMDVDQFHLDIKFQNGVIEIPPLEVWVKKNAWLLNLVAFEQCYRHCKRYYAAYIHFMDCLIKSAKDVEILCQKGIIINFMGSEQNVAAFFNNIRRETNLFVEEFYLSDVCNEINRYSDRALPKLRASLVHDYFKNPWAIISFLAALILLLLTTVQAFFSSFPKFSLK